jgi:multidrug resistance efflux pump
MARLTALKLEASSFRLRLETTQSDLKKAQDELRSNAENVAKGQAAIKAQASTQAERCRKLRLPGKRKPPSRPSWTAPGGN